MKKIMPMLMLSVLTLFSYQSIAAESGWITYAKVTKVVVTMNGGVNIALSPALSGCTSQSGYGERYASLYPDHPGLDKIHSIVLAAFMADKPIAVWLSDNTCKIGEVELGGRQ
jgi:hypothetical protein